MFEHTSLITVLMPTIVVLVVASYIMHLREKPSSNPALDALVRFRRMTIGTGIFLVVLLFCLPVTPVLGTFGFPQTIEDVQSPKRLLDYLQNYDKALVRTTEVLYWFLFVFVWWFLAAVHSMTRAFQDTAKLRPYPPTPNPGA